MVSLFSKISVLIIDKYVGMKNSVKKACITANALGGEFDYKILQSEFDTELLKSWGIEDIDNHRLLDMDNFFNEEKAEVKEKRKKIVTCPHCGKEIAL